MESLNETNRPHEFFEDISGILNIGENCLVSIFSLHLQQSL